MGAVGYLHQSAAVPATPGFAALRPRLLRGYRCISGCPSAICPLQLSPVVEQTSFGLVLPLYKSFAKNYWCKPTPVAGLPACDVLLLKQAVKPPEIRSPFQGFVWCVGNITTGYTRG